MLIYKLFLFVLYVLTNRVVVCYNNSVVEYRRNSAGNIAKIDRQIQDMYRRTKAAEKAD